MHELLQVADNTYYLSGSTNIGFCLMPDREVYLIDSGDDDSDAQRVLQILEDKNWRLSTIINTHSHPDHIGGNNRLQRETGCKIYCCPGELGFVGSPVDDGTVMLGAYPSREFSKKCVKAKPSAAKPLTAEVLPQGFELMDMPGHAVEMYGVKTPDGVWFIADSLVSESFVTRFHMAFLYHPGAYIKTLERVKSLEASAFVPSHVSAKREIAHLAQVNISEVRNVMGVILETCKSPKCFDEVLKGVLDTFGYSMDYNLYMVVGSVVRSYISYLQDEGLLLGIFEDNRLLWKMAD